MITESQFQTLTEYRRLFFETGKIHEHVRPFVAESWLRSVTYGVNPDPAQRTTVAQEFLPDNEMKELLNNNKQLLDVAYPIMSRALEYIEGTQYALTLHDRDSRLICHMFAGDNPGFYSSSMGFNIGAPWDEKTVGTCAPFLCISLDRDVQLVGPEHFSSKLCNLTCSSSPIHNKNGDLVACLNIFGDYKKTTAHTLAFLKEVALLIESELELRENSFLVRKVFNLMSDGLIVLNKHFQVIQVSLKAAAILQVPQKSIYSLDFREVFRKEDFETRLLTETLPFSYSEYELTIAGKEIICNVTITPMLEGGKHDGAIITLREIHQINKTVNRISGNHASYCFDDIISQDTSITALKKMLKNVCSTDHCILLEGESGTGKELFAHALHSESNRRAGPFITINCGSLPRTLVESELFGYEKGAFTGARSEGSPGKFELADGGTLFLDEIGELPLEIQASLLRVLDNHRIRRIGAKVEKELNVRVVAATNRNLYQEVKNGNFRSDLYFRISVLKYDIPPLRERGNDVLLLAERFLGQMNKTNAQGDKTFSEELRTTLKEYTWPGNIRELHNVVARSFYASTDNIITPKELPKYILDEVWKSPSSKGHNMDWAPSSSANSSLKAFERQKIIEALSQCNGNAVEAGRLLGFSRSTIYRRMKEYHIRADHLDSKEM